VSHNLSIDQRRNLLISRLINLCRGLLGGDEGLGELLDLFDEARLGGLELGLDCIRGLGDDLLDLLDEGLRGSVCSLLVRAHNVVEDGLCLGGELGNEGLGLNDHLLLLLETEVLELVRLLLLVGRESRDGLVDLG
ncbi:hypothetical protein PMAYCL1PPCAC_19168, partial [Pristionchus mayeri]